MDSVQQQQLSQAFSGIDIGGSARVHLGNAYHINQAAPYRPETPPNPLSTVPFPRDPDFVDRSAILGQVKEKLAVPAARVALVGLGGVGKSQLAIEWSYRKRDESPDTWVLWIHASSGARFEQSIRNILDQLKVSGRSDSQANVFQLLRTWLYDAKKGSWLVILDNADDVSFLLEPPDIAGQVRAGASSERRLDYIPTCSHGSLLITSRSRAAALRMVEHDSIVDVGPMEEEHALALLTKKLTDTNEQAEIAGLAHELEYMPLAIVQASAYIRQRAPRCTVREYMAKLAKNERSKLGLLNRDEGDLRRDREARNSIILTWEISFEHIRSIRSSAADLLSLMSFFDRQAIPARLLKTRTFEQDEAGSSSSEAGPNGEGFRANTGSASSNGNFSTSTSDEENTDSEDDENFEDDLKMLRDYSFVSITADADVFGMHRLAQLATQRWLKVNESFERWCSQFISNLEEAYPTPEFENWTECQSLFPHAMIACNMTLTKEKSTRKQAALLFDSGQYALEKGAYVDAERMAAKSLEIHRQVLGDENGLTIVSKEGLAEVYRNLGRYAEAKVLQVQVMESSQRVLGDQHQGTLVAKGNLALLYSDFGEYNEAKKLQREVLKWAQRVLGGQHRVTMTARSGLAGVYGRLGRYQESQELHLEVLEWKERAFGNEHPATMSTKDQLASTYEDLGKFKDAGKLQLEVLEWRKRVLGDEHPSTMICKNDLAVTYRYLKKYTEAEELGVSVLKYQRQALGDEHPFTMVSMTNYASNIADLGRHEEAAELLSEALEWSIRALGDEHPHTLVRKHSLALTYRDLGKIEEAKELESEVLERRRTLLGEDHPGTILSMESLARIQWDREQEDIAIGLMERAAELSSLVLGDDHPLSIDRREWVAEWSNMRNGADERDDDGRGDSHSGSIVQDEGEPSGATVS